MIRREISSTIRKVFDTMYKDPDSLIPRKRWVTAQVLVAAINCDLTFQEENIQTFPKEKRDANRHFITGVNKRPVHGFRLR